MAGYKAPLSGRSLIGPAREGAGGFSRVNGQGTWKDINGKVSGYSDTEDSPIKRYVAQRQKAKTKGY